MIIQHKLNHTTVHPNENVYVAAVLDSEGNWPDTAEDLAAMGAGWKAPEGLEDEGQLHDFIDDFDEEIIRRVTHLVRVLSARETKR